MAHAWRKRWDAARAEGPEAVEALRAEVAALRLEGQARQVEADRAVRDDLARVRCVFCGAQTWSRRRLVCPPCRPKLRRRGR